MALISRSLNPNRSFALDVFRGLTIGGMILVTTPGGPVSYAPLQHAAWNGWTVTDLIFPSFAFIIGVALPYSLASRRTRGEWPGLSLFDWIIPILLVIKWTFMFATRTGDFGHAPVPAIGGYDCLFLVMWILLVTLPQLERRAWGTGRALATGVVHHGFLLFATGFIWTFDTANPAGFRLLAVLQRLGIVYLVAGLIVLGTGRRSQLVWATALLVIYWVLMKGVPVPGYGAGVLTMAGNFAGYVDRLIVGSAHMYLPGPPAWDPEGLLGAIPAIATGLLGALAGDWLRQEVPIGKRMSGLFVAGTLLLVAGLSLDPWFPINKNLWSPPYVLLAGGIDCVVLGACVWLFDVKLVRKGFLPFIVLGSNAILIYLLSGTVRHYAGELPGGTIHGAPVSAWDAAYHRLFASWLDPYNASLAMALLYVGGWTFIAGWLYRRRIFVKI